MCTLSIGCACACSVDTCSLYCCWHCLFGWFSSAPTRLSSYILGTDTPALLWSSMRYVSKIIYVENFFTVYRRSVTENFSVWWCELLVVLLTEVDRLTKDAQHALRRTMEKYCSTCRLILCCNSSTRVIPAIRSRCLAVRVAAPTHDEVAILRSVHLCLWCWMNVVWVDSYHATQFSL